MACYHAVVRYSLIKRRKNHVTGIIAPKHSPRFFTNLCHATLLFLLRFIRQIHSTLRLISTTPTILLNTPTLSLRVTHVQDNVARAIFDLYSKYLSNKPNTPPNLSLCTVDFQKGSRQSDKIEACGI